MRIQAGSIGLPRSGERNLENHGTMYSSLKHQDSSPPLTSPSRRALIGLGLAAALIPASGPGRADPLLTYPLKIKGHALRAELANTEETRRTGLMHRRSMAESQGMLFIYEQPGLHAMWMKNTLIPLSVAFLDRDGRIINIEDMEPQTLDAHGAAAAASYSLEMNRGWFAKRGIRPGDRVEGLKTIPR